MIDIGVDNDRSGLRTLVFQALKHYKTRALFPFLLDSTAIVRSAAARELQSRGGREVFEEGLLLLRARRADVREVAAFLLGQLGYPSKPFAEQSVAPLVAAMQNDPSRNVRATAAAALGHLGLTDALEPLLQASRDESRDIRSAAAFALWMMRDDDRARRRLRQLRKDEDDDVRSWAIMK